MKTIRSIQKGIDYELITTHHERQCDYYSESFLKENYYDKCFLSLNFTHGGAMQTTAELGLMGRKTIVGDIRLRKKEPLLSFNFYNFPSFIKCAGPVREIITIINNEAKKIGTIQPAMSPHSIGEEWLDTDFWDTDLMDI